MNIKDWFKFGLLGLAWGSSFLWIKIAVQEIGPVLLVTLRIAFSLIGLIIVVFFNRSRLPRPKQWLPFIVLGLTNVALPFLLISWSEQRIDSGVASILNSTVPLFTILIAPIFLQEERITVARIAGLATGFIGVIISLSRGLHGGAITDVVGELTMLLAAVLYAFSAVFARRATQALKADVQALVQMICALVYLSIGLPVLAPTISLPHLPLTWVALAWLGLVGSCLGTLLFYSLLHSIGVTRTMLSTYIFPLVGVILGILFLGEKVTWNLIAGGILILSGIYVVNSGIEIPTRLKAIFNHNPS